MTLAASPRKAGPYVGDGVNTQFPFAFKVFAEADVRVVLTNSDGNTSDLVLNSDFSVLLNPDQDNNPGGTITYPILVGPSPLATTETLTCIGGLVPEQPTDITNLGRFLPQLHENVFDRQTMLIQQVYEVISRCLQASVGTNVSLEFPAPSSGKFLRWRSDLTGLENVLAGTDSMALQGLLADANQGAKMVGYKAGYAGTVARTLDERLNDTVNAKDFGLKTTNTGAQNNTAMAAAISYAVSQGGLTLHIPRGTYDFASTIDLSGANNLTLTGDGIDATILRITSATADFISTGSTIYQTISDLTLSSSVTRTAGSMVKTGYWRRGLIFRVKIEKWFNGVNLFQFEHCSLMETNIVTPTGAGTALIVGNAAATNQGANLNLVTVFIRGNDESVPASLPTGARGMLMYDVEAVYGFNVDISAFTNEIAVVSPSFQAANFFFTSCYFDVTVSGDNFLAQGAGIKNRFQFVNCWFGSAGRMGVGAADKYGVRLADAGSYISWLFDGCEFLGTTGPGVGVFTSQADAIFTGCIFNNCGFNTTLNTAIYASFAATQTKAMQFTGCKFIPSAVTTDFIFTSNARGNIITGCQMLRGISYQGGAQFGNVSGNSDANTADTIASAATLLVPVTKNWLTVSGTTNIGGLFRTFTGHMITLQATGSFTFQNGGALSLAGGVNYAVTAGNTLTLICRPDGTWGEVTRHA